MSAETISSTERRTVYVRLMGEGTEVYRPTEARVVGEETVMLLAPAGYDPDDEQWEFPPGTTVYCVTRNLRGQHVFVAVAKAQEVCSGASCRSSPICGTGRARARGVERPTAAH
jgi:hypothetical protein